MSLREQAKQDAKSDLAAPRGDWFKFKEGDNKIRILTEPIVIFEDFKNGICYTGCGFQGQMKYLAYVYNYGTQQIETMKMPMRVFDSIANLEENEEWSFTGFPMPYGITVNAEHAGTKEVKYSIIPSPKRVDLPTEITEELKKKTPIPELVQRFKDKNKKAREVGESVGSTEYPKDDFNSNDVPF